MNSAEDDPGASLPRQSSEFEPAERIGCMHADADHVAGPQSVRIESFQSLVGDDRITVGSWRRCRNDV